MFLCLVLISIKLSAIGSKTFQRRKEMEETENDILKVIQNKK